MISYSHARSNRVLHITRHSIYALYINSSMRWCKYFTTKSCHVGQIAKIWSHFYSFWFVSGRSLKNDLNNPLHSILSSLYWVQVLFFSNYVKKKKTDFIGKSYSYVQKVVNFVSRDGDVVVKGTISKIFRQTHYCLRFH